MIPLGGQRLIVTLKIMNENRAGKNQADVFDGTTTVVPLKRAGYVMQWLPDAAKNYPPQYKDGELEQPFSK